MDTVRVVIKELNKEPQSFLVKEHNLDRLVTNLKLYQKDSDFVSQFQEDYKEFGRIDSLPSKLGIVFIDFVHNTILDGQMSTGIGCVAQNEIILSLQGKIADETTENSVSGRVAELYKDGRLIGFEEWQDNRIKMKSLIEHADKETLFSKIAEISSYGQFRFDTSPFRIESYTDDNYTEKLSLFVRAKELNLIPETEQETWNAYLERMKP